MHRLATIGALTAAMVLPAMGAVAMPSYAAKEHKTCSYCHTRPTGGPLGPAGKYYAAHNHSLAGYEEGGAAPAAQNGPPVLNEAWRMQVPDDAERIAVTEVAADKKARVLLVNKAGALTAYLPKTAELQKEGSVDLGANAQHFVAGSFVKDQPGVIVVPGAAFYLKGDQYTRLPLADLTDITGTVRFNDGAEEFFYFAGNTPDVWMLNPTASNPLVAGRELVLPDQGSGVYSQIVAHLTPAALAAFGLPEAAQKPGVIGGLDPLQNGHFYAWMPWQEGGKWSIVLAEPSAISPMGNPPELKQVWRSDTLPGDVLDIAVGKDPFTGKTRGLYVLTATGAEKRQRTLQYLTAGKVEKPQQ